MNFLLFYLLIPTLSFAQETYLAKLQTLNPQINGNLSGSTTFYIKDDQLLVFNRLFAGAPNVIHRQNIFLGKRCPVWQDDLNQDGILDSAEGKVVWGNVLVPLDGDLSSQYKGLNIFPVANMFGTYFYEKDTQYSKFLKDLKSIDSNPDDDIVKLRANEDFQLEEKVVVIQGTTQDATLPIACGVFKRL